MIARGAAFPVPQPHQDSPATSHSLTVQGRRLTAQRSRMLRQGVPVRPRRMAAVPNAGDRRNGHGSVPRARSRSVDPRVVYVRSAARGVTRWKSRSLNGTSEATSRDDRTRAPSTFDPVVRLPWSLTRDEIRTLSSQSPPECRSDRIRRIDTPHSSVRIAEALDALRDREHSRSPLRGESATYRS